MSSRLRLLRNMTIVAMASYLEAAVGLAVGAIIARALGPEEYGHYAYLVWLCGVLVVACNNALTTSSVRFIAEARGAGDASAAGAIDARIRRYQVASSTLVLLAFAACAVAWPLDEWKDGIAVVVPLMVVAIWSRASFWILGAIGKGHERFEPENLTLGLNALANLALASILAFAGAGTLGFFALYAGLGLSSTLMVRLLLRRAGVRPRPGAIAKERLARLHRHLAQSSALTALNVATSRSVEMAMLKAFADNASVGYFAIASSLTKGAVDVVAGGLAAVLLPSLSKSFGRGGPSAVGSIVSESLRLYWALGLAIAGGGLVVAPGIVHLLYGARYDAAIPVLTAQIAIVGMLIVNGTAAATLTASDRQADRIVIALIGLAVNVPAAYVLIPRFGALGAVASFGITQGLETLMAFVRLRRVAPFRVPVASMSRLALAAGSATALGFAIATALDHPAGFVAGGAAMFAAYLGLSIVLRAWNARDFELAAAVLGRAGSIGTRAAGAVLHLRSRFAAPLA